MSAVIIDGREMSRKIRISIRRRVDLIRKQTGKTIGLAVVLVGDDPASAIYVRGKQRDCEKVGIASSVIRMPAASGTRDVEAAVRELNADASIHGILVQFPLPAGLDSNAIIQTIDPTKDVDGFHVVNCGMLLSGVGNPMIPCTPLGIVEMIRSTDRDMTGSHAVVVGRSNLVGKPVSLLLQRENATVTMCHSRTVDLAEHTRRADILVVAAGRRGLVTGDMVKHGAVVIDVGMNRDGDRVVGDVDFDSAAKRAGWITPVPGGVGPMTRAILLQNTLQAFKRNG
ncbi:MAG: bifunctional methylenetetrahydrofolate dehydrogenase/methenyltetrahydrofolate cyclohydrolase FolD [Clostridiales bacterium]|nr:bifunctional methylenetetrahydrofolate dehydrogenase/methenyltetrahydrofolate cyclohydrolase FolD [Clostridiales bacterium]